MNLIALDLDGTLEDSRDDMVDAIHRVRSALELPPRADNLVQPWVSQGMDNLYRHCFDDFGVETADRYAVVQHAYEIEYLANVATHTQLYPGIREALPLLQEFGSLAVVTNKPEHISVALLAELEVAHHFAAVIGGDTCEKPKPDPMMIAEAVDQTRAEGRVIMIGDSGGDLKMARGYGAISVWCRWGYYDAQPGEADHIADRPQDLPEVVRHILTDSRPPGSQPRPQ